MKVMDKKTQKRNHVHIWIGVGYENEVITQKIKKSVDSSSYFFQNTELD